MAGDTRQLKSVVRQVWTSRVQPHWQRRWCSSASRSLATIDARAPGLGGSTTGRDAVWSMAKRFDESATGTGAATPWADATAAIVTDANAPATTPLASPKNRRRDIAGVSLVLMPTLSRAREPRRPPAAPTRIQPVRRGAALPAAT